jgi:hypothetical protein
MPWNSLFSALQYGTIGLGLALAVLAFFLLRGELRREPPSRDARPIYVFMAFSLALVAAGLFLQRKAPACNDISELGTILRQIESIHNNGRKAVEAAYGTTSTSETANASSRGALNGWLTQTDPAVKAQLQSAYEYLDKRALLCKP